MKTSTKNQFLKRVHNLKQDIPAVWLALRHSQTPFSAKIIAAITIIYALSPIDLIPDFIPVIGLLDDIILLPFLVALTIRLVPTDIMQQCRKDAYGLWTNGKPKKWYYALPIILIWALVVTYLLSLFIV